ncbi:hypothetical protein ILYODFUR_021028 [Ilyodon furcidens]|uniref:Uncharacterized protein n=1 Tax=Ilyodon furcidens TaxID=33524 RepID=A0ABV0SRG6_9TELE
MCNFCIFLRADKKMGQKNVQQDFGDQFNDVISRLQSKQLFQSDWDIASFAVFLIFIGKFCSRWQHIGVCSYFYSDLFFLKTLIPRFLPGTLHFWTFIHFGFGCCADGRIFC